MINLFIYTYNPVKLDLTLRSINALYPTHPMIYCFQYKQEGGITQAYNKLDNQWMMECMVIHKYYNSKKASLKATMGKVMELTGFEYTLFLTDNEIFTQPFDHHSVVDVFERRDVLTHSISLGRNIQNYPVTSTVRNGRYLYDWKSCSETFKKPYSIQGNIYRTRDVLRWMSETEFTTPKEMIIQFSGTFTPETLMSHSEKSSVVSCFNDVDHSLILNNKIINHDPYLFLQHDSIVYNEPYDIVWRG